MKKGFTLIEMLVVIGIIAILIGASLAGFNKMKAKADRAQAVELVSNVATALGTIYEKDGMWPKRIRENGATDGVMDQDVALILAKRGNFSLTMANGKLAGKDRFGILTPWAQKIVDRKGASASLSTPVTGSSTVQDHLLHFAVDVDGDGIIDGANVGGETVPIRASVAVWCIGKSGGDKGKLWAYTRGLKHDDIYSWSVGQTKAVK